MSVSLSVAFTGLCALIGGTEGRPGEMLLVDPSGIAQADGITFPAHIPTLVVSLNDLANPDSSQPSRVVAGKSDDMGRIDQLGVWDLTASEVRIRAQGGADSAGLQFFQPSKHDTSWPDPPHNVHDPAAWRDIRFVPHMAALVADSRIHPSLIGSGEAGQREIPRSVAARVYLDAGLLRGALPSQASYREDVFDFKSSSKSALHQALTDTVEWTFQTDAAAIVVEITPVATGQTKRLLLAPSRTPHRLFVSNLPAEAPDHVGAHGANGVGTRALHFGAYYALLMNQPTDPPLPELQDPMTARKGSGSARPFICMPAVFSRP